MRLTLGLGLGTGVSLAAQATADSWADGPPPPGFRWDFLYDDITGERVNDDVTGTPVVCLVEV